MSVVMRSVHKVRVKALKRVQRNIGASEMNVWEPDEEEKPDAAPASDRFSLGTSLSRSTLTEQGSSLVHSDADTFSETLSFEERTWMHFYQRYTWVLLMQVSTPLDVSAVMLISKLQPYKK